MRGVIAQSTGGNAGVGWYGLTGGSGGGAGLTSTAAVSLAVNWGAPELNQTVGLAAVSQGGFGTATTKAGKEYGGGGGGDAAMAVVETRLGGDVSIVQANAPPSQSEDFARAFPNPNPATGPFAGAGDFVGAGVVASSWGGIAGQGYDHAAGGHGGNTQGANVSIYDSSVTITSSGLAPGGSGQAAMLTPGVLAQTVGGRGGDGGLQQNHSSGGDGGSSGPVNVIFAATSATPAGTVRTISTRPCNRRPSPPWPSAGRAETA
ncbi:hypothetical protein ABLE91_01115 [Aquabacter sp. CN5-332]|uniref:hypothetical protein n=1 Tax=Aquabacter sp. CN5-332 TaxID=3156608 RepID=UPI0032B34BE9